MVIRAERALCAKVLEPLLGKFGNFAVTFGYQCREAMEASIAAAHQRLDGRSSSPQIHG